MTEIIYGPIQGPISGSVYDVSSCFDLLWTFMPSICSETCFLPFLFFFFFFFVMVTISISNVYL